MCVTAVFSAIGFGEGSGAWGWKQSGKHEFYRGVFVLGFPLRVTRPVTIKRKKGIW